MKVVQRYLLALSCITSVVLSPVAAGSANAAAPAADPLPSWDRTIFRPTGDVTVTRISGLGGRTDIVNTPTPDFLYALRGSERGDKPCDNRAYFFFERPESPRVPTRIGQRETELSVRCGSSATPNSARSASVRGGGIRHSDGRVRVVAGVRVCLNKKRTRVKGIQVFGASIDNDGDVRRDSAYDHRFTRSNCSAPWEQPRLCPSGQVATGVHYNYSGSSLVGIALECQAVRTVQLVTRD